MTGGSFSVWAIILLFGLIFSIVTGFVNPYVPIDQKVRAKKLSVNVAKQKINGFIVYRNRLSENSYILLSMLIVIIAIVAFVIEDFFDYVRSLGGDVFGVVVVVAAIFMASLFVEMIYLLTMCLIEDKTISRLRVYYGKHYGVSLVHERDAYYYVRNNLHN